MGDIEIVVEAIDDALVGAIQDAIKGVIKNNTLAMSLKTL